jgi:hypothetical protein
MKHLCAKQDTRNESTDGDSIRGSDRQAANYAKMQRQPHADSIDQAALGGEEAWFMMGIGSATKPSRL